MGGVLESRQGGETTVAVEAGDASAGNSLNSSIRLNLPYAITAGLGDVKAAVSTNGKTPWRDYSRERGRAAVATAATPLQKEVPVPANVEIIPSVATRRMRLLVASEI